MAFIKSSIRFIVGALILISSSVYSSNTIHDPMSFANLADVETTHVHFKLNADFEKKRFSGYIEHQLRWKTNSQVLQLDSKNLVIDKVSFFSEGSWKALPSSAVVLAQPDPILGQKLTLSFPSQPSTVRIYYQTTEKSSGLQWLSKEQTYDKTLPFMFSQSQAIHARSWMPIQDTPAMRITYSADITTPKQLFAVMSADNAKNLTKNKKVAVDGSYTFNMQQAIPPYLIAIAIGDIRYQAMSDQTGIYAEPYILEKAAKEFEDTQAMMDATNKLYGEYAWGQFDILVLPPSFPFGGMENPRLTFATPTVIAGDKSLVSLIAHELAHSWSGNLVTNATWNDLWLNEGFTTYVENRIMEEVFGKDRAIMEQALGLNSLRRDLVNMEPKATTLKADLAGQDPDYAFSEIPYVKGQMFLLWLEAIYGRETFDEFVKGYFAHFSFRSLDTTTFLTYIEKHLINKYPNKATMQQIRTWIFGQGLSAMTPNPTSDAFTKVKQAQVSWLNGDIPTNQLPVKTWTVHEWLFFINQLPRDLSYVDMAKLDSAFRLSQTQNAEIAFAWFNLAIGNGYGRIYAPLEEYLVGIGRRKLIIPLYRKLLSTKGKADWARKVFKKARPGYHPTAQQILDNIMEQYKDAK